MRQVDEKSIECVFLRVNHSGSEACTRTLNDRIGSVPRSNPADDLGDAALVLRCDHAKELRVRRELLTGRFMLALRSLRRGFATLGLILADEVSIRTWSARTACVAL